MPSNFLERRLQTNLSNFPIPLNSTQIKCDQILNLASNALGDPYSLTGMALAPLFGKLTRVGALLGAERFFAISSSTLTHVTSKTLSAISGFGVEVMAYESIQRSTRIFFGGAPSSLLGWENLSAGLSHSFINFGILKVAGTSTAGTNLLLNHFATDAAIVAANQAAAALHIITTPSESLAEQFVIADAMNWQMKAGLSFFYTGFPGLGLKVKNLELAWQSKILSSSWQFAKAYSFEMDTFKEKLIFMNSSENQRASELLAKIEECTAAELQELFHFAKTDPAVMKGLLVYTLALDVKNIANHRTVVRRLALMAGEVMAFKAKSDQETIDVIIKEASLHRSEAFFALGDLGWSQKIIALLREVSRGDIEAIHALHEISTNKEDISGDAGKASRILKNIDVKELLRRAENEADVEAAQALYVIAQHKNKPALEYVEKDQAAIQQIGIELMLEVISAEPDAIDFLVEAATRGETEAFTGLKLMAQRGNVAAEEALKTLQNIE